MNVAPLSTCFITSVIFLFSKLCPICIFTLDFAAGPASLRSAHMTLLNKFTKSESPDGLKPLKVIAHSHLNRLKYCTLPAWRAHLRCWVNTLSFWFVFSFQNLTHLEKSKDQLSNTNPQAECKLCSKPVHLIQRHLVDGEVYHRSCFR